MSVYMKNFIFASLTYLGLATIFGILNGMTDIGYIGVFAHTHFNLLGFMAMIVYGIGYFIIPRFNGADLRFENWVTYHFWLGNISLVAMVIFRGLEIEYGSDILLYLFITSASLHALSIFMFIINIWLTLTPAKKAEVTATTPQPEKTEQVQPTNFVIDKDTRPTVTVVPSSEVGALVDRCLTLQQVLIDCGLLALQMPGHLDKVRQMGITLEMAANNHGLDLDDMIARIKVDLENNGFATGSSQPTGSAQPVDLSLDTLIGDVIRDYPASKDVFQKYFGDGCFECPGQSYESIDMACRMHNVEPKVFFEELKDKVS